MTGQQKIDLRINNSRPKIGTSRRIALTMPDDLWDVVDELIQSGQVKNQSEALRFIVSDWNVNKN